VQVAGALAELGANAQSEIFAKSSVDHIWQYFFGVNLTEPIFEEGDDSTPAHPELLNELAKSFIDSGFDIKFLIRAIVMTEAYQRASVAMSPDTREATNFYIWESDAAARAFFNEQLVERVTGLYGVRPTIQFVEIATLVDNGGG